MTVALTDLFPNLFLFEKKTVRFRVRLIHDCPLPSIFQGLGVSEESAELLVSKPFFVSLQLPYSIVRGEEFALRVVVFNYEQHDVETMVVLAGNSSFQNIVYK